MAKCVKNEIKRIAIMKKSIIVYLIVKTFIKYGIQIRRRKIVKEINKIEFKKNQNFFILKRLLSFPLSETKLTKADKKLIAGAANK